MLLREEKKRVVFCWCFLCTAQSPNLNDPSFNGDFSLYNLSYNRSIKTSLQKRRGERKPKILHLWLWYLLTSGDIASLQRCNTFKFDWGGGGIYNIQVSIIVRYIQDMNPSSIYVHHCNSEVGHIISRLGMDHHFLWYFLGPSTSGSSPLPSTPRDLRKQSTILL